MASANVKFLSLTIP